MSTTRIDNKLRSMRWQQLQQGVYASLDEAVDWICRAVSRRLTTGERLLAAHAARSRARWRKELRLALADVAGGGRSVLELRYITGVERDRADNRRDSALAALGVMTVRYSWTDVTERPCTVAAEVAALLNVRGAPTALRQCGPDCAAAS